MQLAMIGSGYVGLVSGACLAEMGHDVSFVDCDASRIAELDKGHCPIFEPGLTELLTDARKAGRAVFTTDLPAAVARAEVVFIGIGTPPRQDGSADISAIETAARQIAEALTHYTVVVVKSTVPVGTGEYIQRLMGPVAADEFDVVSNPEFLKEGTAVEDFQRPDRVVIGTESPRAAKVMERLYAPFLRTAHPIIPMGREAAEMTKYACNALLATRISFINEIANLCEARGIDVNQVRLGMGHDRRIGFSFLFPGVGYGGSCLPKDVQALAQVARESGRSPDLFRIVHEVNQRQKEILWLRASKRFGKDLSGKTFALWGISFKPKTDDLREAPALTLIDRLLKAGATIRCHDPHALENLRRIYGEKLTYAPNAYDALDDAEALLIATEWEVFRSPDFDRMKSLMKNPVIFDGRNLYDPDQMKELGIEYYSIGRPTIRLSCGGEQ